MWPYGSSFKQIYRTNILLIVISNALWLWTTHKWKQVLSFTPDRLYLQLVFFTSVDRTTHDLESRDEFIPSYQVSSVIYFLRSYLFLNFFFSLSCSTPFFFPLPVLCLLFFIFYPLFSFYSCDIFIMKSRFYFLCKAVSSSSTQCFPV